MSFFIPEHTTCRICGRAIARRIDAVRLDWVHPDDEPELAQYGRGYVHGDCWRQWEHREAFTAAARALRLRATEDRPLFVQDGVFLYQRGSALSIEDVAPPIEIFISEPEKPLVPAWLIDVITAGPQAEDAPPEQLVMGNHSLSASWSGDDLEITLAYDGEPTERFTLSAERRVAWLAVLRVAAKSS